MTIEQPALDLDGDKYPGRRWFVRDPTEPHDCTEGCDPGALPGWHEVTHERYRWESVKGEGPGVTTDDGSVPPPSLIWPYPGWREEYKD